MRQCVTLRFLLRALLICAVLTRARKTSAKNICNTSKPVLIRDSAASSKELIADAHASWPHDSGLWTPSACGRQALFVDRKRGQDLKKAPPRQLPQQHLYHVSPLPHHHVTPTRHSPFKQAPSRMSALARVERRGRQRDRARRQTAPHRAIVDHPIRHSRGINPVRFHRMGVG